ncbi:hypothetical protein QL996_12640 [Planococcus sp. APC 4015]|nr:hypothetical protein [Planococcus sp. APC 4015]
MRWALSTLDEPVREMTFSAVRDAGLSDVVRGAADPNVYRLRMARSGQADPARHINNLTTVLVAVGFVICGATFLWLSTKTYAPADIWILSLYGQLGGLLLATGLITFVWDLVGKRAFAAEVLSKTQLRADIVTSGLERVTEHYLQDVEWEGLFATSRQLDIVVAYASTWRNTHRARLQALASKKNGRLRVFLPDPDDLETMAVLSRRFKMTVPQLQEKINEAIEDFQSFGVAGNVEVYLRAGDAVFSCYQFDNQSVMTLYSHSQERRGSVPTFLVGAGLISDFIASDVEAIHSQSRKI